jgi:radical SAM protein with 4Fe4S-binding SPASM domain
MYAWFDRNIVSVSHLSNRLRLVSSFRRRSPVVGGRPNIVYVETTNVCNLECPMCPTTIMVRPAVNMAYDTWTTAIDQLDPSVTELVVLHSDGEPLINKRVFDMIDYAKAKGLRLYTSTNATALNEKNARALLESGLDVLTISIDGTTKEVFEKIRVGAKFESVMDNVHRFLELKGHRKPLVIVQLIEQPDNEHQTAEFVEYWSRYRSQGVIPVIKGLIEWFTEIPDIIDNYNWCDRPWFGLVVHSSGNVSPCVHDFDGRYVVGNIKEANLYDMWNGERMVELRKSITVSRRSNELCKDCNYAPPMGHNWFVDAGLAAFDMCTVAKLIPRIGFHRQRQYRSRKGGNKVNTKAA